MSDLLTEIETFCAAHEMSDRRFGELALNDTGFVRQLRDGREPRRKTEQRARSFIAAYIPAKQAA